MLSCLRIFQTDFLFPCLISHFGSYSYQPYSLSAVCGRVGEMNLEGVLTSTSRFTALVRRQDSRVRTDCNPSTVGQPVWSQSVALAVGLIRCEYALRVNFRFASSARPRPLTLRPTSGPHSVRTNLCRPAAFLVLSQVYPFRGNRPVPGSAYCRPWDWDMNAQFFISPAECNPKGARLLLLTTFPQRGVH
jgi:hypothetical protein